MRKFKLIKTYPGSLELGAIRKDFDNPILSKYFTDYPEFWEEVIEPDFEILAFKQDSGITDLWTYFPGAGWSRNVNGHPATAPYTIDLVSSIENGIFKKDGNSLLVNPKKNHKQWAQHMKKLIENPNMIEDMGNRLYETVYPKYSLRKVSQDRVEFFKSIVKN